MRQCDLDYETRSEVDVRDVGSVTYAKHPSTEILCLAYKIDDGPTQIWIPDEELVLPAELWEVLDGPDVILIAHNALFEQMITKHVLRKYLDQIRECQFKEIPISRWRCSAAKAASCALPRKLEKAGAALKLSKQKDMVGHRLMLKHCKPRPVWKKWNLQGREGPEPKKYFDDPEERKRIYKYCIRDVDVEHEIYRRLPDLSTYEQGIWELNQKMNIRGVLIDIPTVKRIVKWIKVETVRLNDQLQIITKGKVESVNSVPQFTSWVRSKDITIPNLQAQTVTDLIEMLEKTPTKKKRRVIKALKIRQTLGKASVKKYNAMLQRVDADNRVTDYAMYWGASTGRESGKGLQLQNLVKGKIKNPELAIELINNSTLEEIRFLYGDPMEVFVSCLRSMVIASPGYELHSADYNAIEARILLWMAGDKAGIKRYLKKIDSYVLMAAKIFGILLTEVTYDQRDLGKRAELGCGFGMGAQKFMATCHKYGAKYVTLELAKRAVNIYRNLHPEVPQMWANLEMAAIKAVQRPGRVIKVNRTSWKLEGEFLACTLPSGRKLRFYRPSVKHEPAPWGDLYPRLYHWQEIGPGKVWQNASTYGGKLTENVVQATARDIMVNGTLHCVKNKYRPLFSVHDETNSERKIGRGNPTEYEQTITTLPIWANGLPIVAKGWKGPRYKKV